MTDHPSTVQSARAALTILEDAKHFGRPLPFEVDATDYGSITLHFRLDALTEWALQWSQTVITSEDGSNHSFEVERLGYRVRCAAHVAATAVA